MKISANIQSRENVHNSSVKTNDAVKAMHIDPKLSGFGSSVNGGELLMLALATCFCNDLYREAARRKMNITSVEVEVSGDFGAEGEPASNVDYRATVTADASDSAIQELIDHTDKVAEIHNTLRKGVSVNLVR